MGKTWRLGPLSAGEETFDGLRSTARRSSSTSPVLLHGADLYRFNCEGCHGESGLGAPPEIASIINPVRATSASLVMQRMKAVGADVSRAQVMELAGQSKASLLQRLHTGGQDMPSFSYLDESEVRALIAYLNLLAGVPNAAARQSTVFEPHARVGELIVKSTCHICHAATGLNPGPAELASGAIPALGTLTGRVSRAQLIRKVTAGAPITMGAVPDVLRSRMPVFFYLTESEAADVYEYLDAYPPSDTVNPHSDVKVLSAQSAATSGPSLPTGGVRRPSGLEPESFASRNWFVFLSAGVLALMAVGVVFTRREFQRLTTKAHINRTHRPQLGARALQIVAPHNSRVEEETSRRPIALVASGGKHHANRAKRWKDWWAAEEFGDAC